MGADAVLNGAFTTLGLRLEIEIGIVGNATARLSGGIGWRYALGGVTPTTVHSFSGGKCFYRSRYADCPRYLVLDLGVDIELSKTAMLGVSYSGQIAANAADHDVKLDFSVAY